MRILQVNASYKPAYIYGGTTYSVSLLCEQLAIAGEKVQVLTTTANGKDDFSAGARTVDGVAVCYFKRITKDHSHLSPALTSALYRLSGEFSVVHIHSWWNLVSILSAFVCRSKNVPFVLSPRGMFSDYSFSPARRLFHRFIGKRILRNAHFHATSPAEKKEISNLFPGAEITMIPNMVKLPTGNTLDSKPAGSTFRLIFLSRIDPKKGIELLFRSLASLDIDYILDIAGTGDSAYVEQLQTTASFLRLDRKINWKGVLFNEDKFDALAAADIFVLPSHNENFANVVIEALSAGTPVIISREVGLASFVEEHDLGWVCDTTPESLNQALQQAYTDEAKRRRINQEAPELVRKHFSAQYLITRYLDLYKRMLNNEIAVPYI